MLWFSLIVAAVPLLIFYGYIITIRMVRKINRCTSEADLTGKTVIVTGANSGIGYETAKELARRNARVIILCRNEEKGIHATNKIIEETKNKNIVLKITDLSLMKSVRKTAEEILREEERLDILINNAGLLGTKKRITEEGLDHTYASNHFGHFLLTNILLDLLKKSAPSRIVNVSSTANRFGKIELDNLCCEQGFPFLRELWYGNTKLANVMFTAELARRLENTGVTTNTLHPGIIVTNFGSRLHLVLRIPLYPLKYFSMTPEEGAQTTIHCAICERVENISGSYFMNCREANQKVNSLMFDTALGKEFWEASERITGLVK